MKKFIIALGISGVSLAAVYIAASYLVAFFTEQFNQLTNLIA